MTAKLYTLDILRLAADPKYAVRLEHPDATVERRSTTCGSSIVVDLSLGGDGRVLAYGHAVRACALGQAAATLVARHAVGRTPDELAAARDAFAAYLAGESINAGDWPGLDVLVPARGYPARHPSLKLAFEAASAAALAAAQAARAAA